MIDRKILSRQGDQVSLKSSMETSILFEGSLIWPMIDSYYVTILFTLSMIKNKNVDSGTISKRIQWLSESLFDDRTLFFFEACNQESIKNAVNALLEIGVIKRKSVFY
jgi:hypothetical protein